MHFRRLSTAWLILALFSACTRGVDTAPSSAPGEPTGAYKGAAGAPASPPALPKPEPGSLVVAAKKGDLAQVKKLLERGADINERVGAEPITPLLAAVATGNTTVARHLIQAGAALHPAFKGYTARDFAVLQNDAETLGVILDREATEDEEATR